jgi:uncharacterized phage-associated protein
MTLDLLSAVWNITKNIDPIKLSNWTHLKDSPWDQAFKNADCKTNCNAPISNELMKRYFSDTFLPKANATN